MSPIERNQKVLRDTSCLSSCWQSENICLTSALSLNRLYLMLEESVMPTAHPYCCGCCLADFCHRLQVIEELSEQTLLAWAYEHSHCPLLSTVWFRMSERLGSALLSSFIEKQMCTCTKHKHGYRPSLNSCHDNVQYPFIPKHIADILKIMCVVFVADSSPDDSPQIKPLCTLR